MKNQKDLLMASLLVLVGIGGFGLGRISAIEGVGKDELTFKKAVMIPFSNKALNSVASVGSSLDTEVPSLVEGGILVASKSGTKYHFPWCSGAKTIKEENKIYFSSKEEAEKAGYTPAGNCKGL